MATALPRKTSSIYDYPEHLNPFREDDNHNKIRFWTIGRKLNRSNSINFSGIKDLKNSWAFRSLMRKGKKGHETHTSSHTSNTTRETKTNLSNDGDSPIMFRRAMQYSSMSRSTVGSPERYVYGGSVTPLPRSRFQERLRSTSQQEVSTLGTPRMARSEISGSRLSVESANPFDGPPVPPVRASRRKKKRAPPPPEAGAPADVSVSSDTSELQTTQTEDKTPAKPDDDLDIDNMNLNIELKIVEDEEDKGKSKAVEDTNSPSQCIKETVEVTLESSPKPKEDEVMEVDEKIPDKNVKHAGSDDGSAPFRKIDIVKYRRNSSVNDDDIRLRRGNLEDFHPLANKRSKSLSNTADAALVTYDINLNEKDTTDNNGNEQPQKVICKLYNESVRKQSTDNSISSTEKEFLEIDKVRREFEREINKLNAALAEDDFSDEPRMTVSDIKRKFDSYDVSSPNPIPKPRRSHNGEPGSPINGNVHTLK